MASDRLLENWFLARCGAEEIYESVFFLRINGEISKCVSQILVENSIVVLRGRRLLPFFGAPKEANDRVEPLWRIGA